MQRMQRTIIRDSDEILKKKLLWTLTELKLNIGRRGKKEAKKKKNFSKAMGSSTVDVKASRWTLWRFNAMPNQALGVWILRFNSLVQIVRSGNYCCSSIRAASIDENKNSHRKITMTHTQTTCPNHFVLRAGKKGARPAEVGALASVFEKSATERKLKQKLLKCKRTIQIATFNVKTSNRIGQLSELTALAIDRNIDIICIQVHS